MQPLIVSRCKVTKSKFGTVRICRFLSEFVSFCRFSERCFFSLQSYEKEIWHCHLLSLFVTFCHLSANCFFTMQSYGKEIWHCPHMSGNVRKCPLLSAFLFRCKVTKSKIGTVQICPIMSKFVHLILRRFYFLPKLFGICDNITQMIPLIAHQTVPVVAH